MSEISLRDRVEAAYVRRYERKFEDWIWWCEEHVRRAELSGWRQVLLALFSPLGTEPRCPPIDILPRS